MSDWCALFVTFYTGCGQAAMTGLSYLFGNNAGWQQLPGKLKALCYAGVTLVIGGVAWAAGHFSGCNDWPPLASAAYVVVMAAVGFFANGYRYERGKAASLSEELADLKAMWGAK